MLGDSDHSWYSLYPDIDLGKMTYYIQFLTAATISIEVKKNILLFSQLRAHTIQNTFLYL